MNKELKLSVNVQQKITYIFSLKAKRVSRKLQVCKSLFVMQMINKHHASER